MRGLDSTVLAPTCMEACPGQRDLHQMEILQALGFNPDVGAVVQELDPDVATVQGTQLHVHQGCARPRGELMTAKQLRNLGMRLVHIACGHGWLPAQNVTGKNPHHPPPTSRVLSTVFWSFSPFG